MSVVVTESGSSVSTALSTRPASASSSRSHVSPYSVLDGLYCLHDEIGSGGFGKVKLATHLLTGQKVAIKIIDKKAIGDDLPRVKVEMEALKTLAHQNICRLYHFIDTREKFFIYCSGGEMFDYIVRKERLKEPEARHFFRQIVQAIAYVHSMGFAHRDLKPENLLLTEDLQLKLIDFGLCAKPNHLSQPLETCCGSPAYAAPELIQGSAYLGNEADIWSMGVLLYALLVGALPFEDDNMQLLYKKIARGAYYEPNWLTTSCKDLLRRMLQVKPKERITIKEILMHPWLNENYRDPPKWNTVFFKDAVDSDVCRELAAHHGMPREEMHNQILEWKYDYLTATYLILLAMKMKGRHFALPVARNTVSSESKAAVVCSPTIHASLDCDLDRSGLEDEDDDEDNHVFVRPQSPLREKNYSYARAILTMPSPVCTGRTPQQRLMPPRSRGGDYVSAPATPVRSRPVARPQQSLGFEPVYYSDYKENRAGSVRVRGPVKVTATPDERPKSVYHTPQRERPALATLFSPGSRPSPRAHSSERVHTLSGGSPSPSPCTERTPRSATKTPRLRQRVFASLERKADRVINLLTPRRVRNDPPQVLKTAKGLVNVSITSSKEPEVVRDELIKVFEQQAIKYEVNGWKISGRQKDMSGHWMTVELEIVVVETLEGHVGVKRKRLNGDAFLYKKVCEQVLNMAGL